MSEMKTSTLRSSEYENQERIVLEGLIDAFSSAFSLRQIASAFCKAGRNPDLAAEILYDSYGNATNSSDTSGLSSSIPLSQSIGNNSSTTTSSDTSGLSSSIPSSQSIGNNSSRSDNYPKASRPKKHSVSTGTVSSVLGKGYAKPTRTTNEACRATKPLKLNMSDLPVAGVDVSSDSVVKNDHMHKDIEEFLFQMLENGFQLGMDVIREVLGSCGYDGKERIEQLMNLSASTRRNSKDIVAGSTRKFADEYPRPNSSSSQENAEHLDLTQRDKERYDLQKEVLSLFNGPERVEEVPKRYRPIRVVKPRPGRKVVSEPLEDTRVHSSGPIEPQEDSEDEEDEDNYQRFLRAKKEHYTTMKGYYTSAFEAFAKGNRALADDLLKQGHYYCQKAREADERSSQLILERKKENHDVVTVDLCDHGIKESLRTLKFYLSTLSGIPSQYLKVILGGDAKDAKKNSRRIKVLELLEKESIKWAEEGNPETILIPLEDINPENLSCIGERSKNDD